MSRVILDAKLAGETSSQVFDFSSRLAAAETISSASTAATTYSGSDASPSSLIGGSSSVSGGRVTQKVVGGTVGVVYLLVCTAITSTGQTLSLSGYLVVTPG